MARTEQEIYDSWAARLAANEILSVQLTDNRDSAIHNQIGHEVSGMIAILEQNNDIHNLTVEDRARSVIVPSAPWYAWASVNTFQAGDTLVFNKETGQYGYAVVNDERKIVDLAACEVEGSRVIIKVLKLVAGVGTPLTGSEKTALDGFWSKYVTTGVFVQVVSQEGDEVDLKALIEVDTDIIGTDGVLVEDGTTRPVDVAITEFYTSYQSENDFNSTFYIQDVERAILAVNGVKNVVINACNIKPLGGSYVDVIASATRKYVPAAGWLKEDSLNPLSTNLTYQAG